MILNFIRAASCGALCLLSACTTLEQLVGIVHSPLSIKTVNDTSSSRVATSYAYEYQNRLHVSGTCQGTQHGHTHLNIELIDAKGNVVDHRTTLLTSKSIPVGLGAAPPEYYLVTFPMEEARKAASIRMMLGCNEVRVSNQNTQ